MLALGIVIGVLFVASVVALRVWVARGERDIEIPARELTQDERLDQVVKGAAAGLGIGGGGAF